MERTQIPGMKQFAKGEEKAVKEIGLYCEEGLDIASLLVAPFGMAQWFVNIPELIPLSKTFNVCNS